MHNLNFVYFRSHDVLHIIPAEAKDQHDEVHRLVFMVCLRMATYKESKVSFESLHV